MKEFLRDKCSKHFLLLCVRKTLWKSAYSRALQTVVGLCLQCLRIKKFQNFWRVLAFKFSTCINQVKQLHIADSAFWIIKKLFIALYYYLNTVDKENSLFEVKSGLLSSKYNTLTLFVVRMGQPDLSPSSKRVVKEVFCKRGVLKNIAKFTEFAQNRKIYLRQSLFLIRLQASGPNSNHE